MVEPHKMSRNLVDPELVAMAESFTVPEYTDALVGEIRASPPYENGAPDPDITIQGYSVTVTGAPDRGLLVLTPKDIQPDAPCLFFVHGGGYVIGKAEDSIVLSGALAKASGCVVVLPSYRLAPEARWPAPIDDLHAQLSWVAEQAQALGISSQSIAVGGGSAGGGHAAALVIRVRDAGGPPILFQLLICPMLDDRHPQSAFAGEYVWTRQADRYGWDSLLGIPTGGEGVPEAAVPGRIQNLGNLPPTYINVGALDLFAESNLEFAKRLMAAGTSVELHIFPGGVHGFEVLSPDSALSKRAVAELQEVLGIAFRRSDTARTG